jgi:hypothetical protein
MVSSNAPKVKRVARLLRDSVAAARAAELGYVSADERVGNDCCVA